MKREEITIYWYTIWYKCKNIIHSSSTIYSGCNSAIGLNVGLVATRINVHDIFNLIFKNSSHNSNYVFYVCHFFNFLRFFPNNFKVNWIFSFIQNYIQVYFFMQCRKKINPWKKIEFPHWNECRKSRYPALVRKMYAIIFHSKI